MIKKEQSAIDQIIEKLKVEENAARKEIAGKFKTEIDYSCMLIATIREILTKHKSDFYPKDVLQGAIIFFLVKGVRTTRAIITLSQSGWSLEILILLRSLFETLINMLYIAEGGQERAMLYVEHDHILRKKMLDRGIEHELKTFMIHATEENKQEILDNYKRVKDNYPNKLSWSNTNISKMAEDVGLKWDYDFIYFLCSNYIHSNVRSSIHYVELDNGSVKFKLGPSQLLLRQNLAATCEYLLRMLKKTTEVFQVELSDNIEHLKEDFKRVFAPQE